MTYDELNARANSLAAYLCQCGVTVETPVALYLDRSFEMVVAILAVLKAGGAYVPIDLSYPPERVNFILQDVAAPLLLTQSVLLNRLPSTTARVICLDRFGSEPIASRVHLDTAPENERCGDRNAGFIRQTVSQSRVLPDESGVPGVVSGCTLASPATPALVKPENAAYIIYTSGSTGKPKGVVVTHRNVVRLLKRTEHWYRFNDTDVWPLFHSYAFDVSVWELWGALFYGGRLVIVPYLTSRSPQAFYELLAREKVTVLNQTPSAFRQLIWAEENAPTKLPLELRYIICAGEALELQSLRPWFKRHGDETPLIVNMYGITEITVHATYRIIREADLTNGCGSVIGVPIPDLQIYLLDDDLKPVGPGHPGEICVAGAGVARGYLNRPELTAKRFIPNPFSTAKGALMYRSGDLAQYSEQGELEFLGRMDHQVKIRGFRVELGEVESALNSHAAVRESVIIAHDDRGGGKRLVAYIVPVHNAPNVSELRGYLSQKVPEYMLPASFVFLQSFPLNSNGKIDRQALPLPSTDRPGLDTDFMRPRNLLEEELCNIWAGALSVTSVGVNDNFFELGGDSILAIRMLTRAQQAGIHFSVHDVFQSPTVAGLAARARQSEGADNLIVSQPFSLVKPEDREKLPAEAEDAYPLSRLQLGMFFHNELNPLSAIYHDVFSFRITAAFDLDMLERAINRLIARHPVLRTSFHLDEFSEPLQIVHHFAACNASRGVQWPGLEIQDVRGKDPLAQDSAITEWIEQEKRKPFERTSPPLVRFQALLLNEHAFQFVVSFHHVCLDGWSLAALITELFKDYASLLCEGDTREIAPPRVLYRDFIALETQAITSEPSRAFWSEKLKDASFCTLPRWPKSYCSPGHEQKRGPERAVAPEVLAGLKRLAQTCGVPLKTVLIAAHQRVAAMLYGNYDVVSGLLCNGRPEMMDGDKLLGLFLNTLPLRVRLTGGSWAELVKQTFAAERELMAHRRFPLAQIQKLQGGRRPFEFACDFVHFHVYGEIESLAGLDVAEGHYFEANDITAFTTFVLDSTSNELQLHIDYDPNELAYEQVAQISEYYLNTLCAMATEPGAAYLDFSPLGNNELHRMLHDWNATEREYPTEATIHSLFEQRAQATPTAIALVSEDRALTYAALDAAANALAERIGIALGTGRASGRLIGIFIDRSPEMLMALLAILKSGAAYVPLDPAYPRERLATILQDACPDLILSQTKLLDHLPQTATPILCLDQSPLPSTQSGAPIGQTGYDGSAASRSAEVPRLTSNHLPLPENEITDRDTTSALPGSPLAYVIYTSGSTGKPKGVQITHRSVVNVLLSAAEKLRFRPDDKLLAVTTLSFDIAALELFMPLICGGTVVLANRETVSNGWKLSGLIDSSGATVMQATPSAWRLLLESGWTGKPSLRMISGGEALSSQLADSLLSLGGEVWNFYGPTESTIWSSAAKMARSLPTTIGTPLANTQFYILDERLQPVPVGTAGELCIGGDGLAMGYLNQPALTSERFITHQLACDSQPVRLYKTGDLARFLPDGSIECLGRRDNQVKIRGFRIELGDIETALREHQGVREAVVTAQTGNFQERRLLAYIVPSNGALDPHLLREYLARKLPHYMIPAQWVFVQKLPTTSNGKIDLKQLPTAQCPDGSKEHVGPRDEDELMLADIWKEVLSVERIGVNDNVFDLGVESLSATRAFARINRQFQTNFSLQEIFENPTISSLVLAVRKNRGTAQVPKIPRRHEATPAQVVGL